MSNICGSRQINLYLFIYNFTQICLIILLGHVLLWPVRLFLAFTGNWICGLHFLVRSSRLSTWILISRGGAVRNIIKGSRRGDSTCCLANRNRAGGFLLALGRWKHCRKRAYTNSVDTLDVFSRVTNIFVKHNLMDLCKSFNLFFDNSKIYFNIFW